MDTVRARPDELPGEADRPRPLMEARADFDADETLYAPMRTPPVHGSFVLGRIAQSLDGRIATNNGNSFWISGPEDVLHTHRLRALADAVVVGAGTVFADDPRLTTRLCPGPSPVRVVLDPQRRLQASHRVFTDGPRTLLCCAPDAAREARLGAAEIVPVACDADGLDPFAVIGALAERGLRRILVEGGGMTISRFLAAGALDRLHVTVAPLLLGAGVPAFTLPCPDTPARGLRLEWTLYRLGRDVLLDVPLDRAKPPMC